MKIGVRQCLPDIFGILIFFTQKKHIQREFYSTIRKICYFGYFDKLALAEVPPFFVEILNQALNNNINDIFKFQGLLISL